MTLSNTVWIRLGPAGQTLFVRACGFLSSKMFAFFPECPRVPTRSIKSEVFPGVMGLSDSLLSCTAQDRDLHILACCNVTLTQHMEHAKRGLWMLREAAQRLKPRSQVKSLEAMSFSAISSDRCLRTRSSALPYVSLSFCPSQCCLILFAPVRPQAWVQRNSFRSVASEQGA